MSRMLLVCAALLAPTPLLSQRLAHLSVTVRPPIPRFEHVLRDGTIPRTYWLEGGVIGAVTVGVLGTVWFRGVSDSRPSFGSTVAIALLCSATGFGPGALIGGQFRKPAKAQLGE
jgi:hypothetical protein